MDDLDLHTYARYATPCGGVVGASSGRGIDHASMLPGLQSLRSDGSHVAACAHWFAAAVPAKAAATVLFHPLLRGTTSVLTLTALLPGGVSP